MLIAVHSIHEERIIHGDLKPANFLFVRGSLKLIDFGIAKAIQNDDTTNIYRENQIGTLNYMSPEAILDSGDGANGHSMKCGRVR
jgi:serine/threonine-protein kinase TTK/MPS1